MNQIPELDFAELCFNEMFNSIAKSPSGGFSQGFTSTCKSPFARFLTAKRFSSSSPVDFDLPARRSPSTSVSSPLVATLTSLGSSDSHLVVRVTLLGF